MLTKIKETFKGYFGLQKDGPFIHADDLQELGEIAHPAKKAIDKALKGQKRRRVEATVLRQVTELASLMLIRIVASGDTEAQKLFALPLFGIIATSKALSYHKLNKWRKNYIAVNRAFSHIQNDPDFQKSEHSHLIGEWQTSINSMISAELHLNNKPFDQMFWLTAKLASIAEIFPAIAPVALIQWLVALTQINISTRVFSKNQTNFVDQVQKNNSTTKRNGETTLEEDEREEQAMDRVIDTTTGINLLAQTSMLPFIYALSTGMNDALAATSLLPALNILSGEILQTLNTTIGAYMALISAKIGREKLEASMHQMKKAKKTVKSWGDWLKFKEKRDYEPSIETTFKEREIEIPEGNHLLLSDISVQRPDETKTLVSGLTGTISLDEGHVVIKGKSGKGKSLLAKTIMQLYEKGTGRSGFKTADGKIEDIRETRTKENQSNLLYINSSELDNSSYLADIVLPYQTQVSILKKHEFPIENSELEFYLRSGWSDKVALSDNTDLLTQAHYVLTNHLVTTINDSGLFPEFKKSELFYFLEAECGNYSDGEKQRLALVHASFIPDIRLLIVDEPFRALDTDITSDDGEEDKIDSKQAVAQYLNTFQEQGTPTLIISHQKNADLRELLGEDNLGSILELSDCGLKVHKRYAETTSFPEIIYPN
jgi:ABC-type multidrug transport system fused ATPase/permease subunit